MVFSNIFDSVASVKEIRLKGRTESWINSNILEDIRRRDNFLYSSKKTKDPALYSDYRRLRNKVQRDARKAKANYFKDKVEEYN